MYVFVKQTRIPNMNVSFSFKDMFNYGGPLDISQDICFRQPNHVWTFLYSLFLYGSVLN